MGGPPGSMGRDIRGDPTRQFPKESTDMSEPPLEDTFSKTRIHVMPKLLLKLMDFGTFPETYETTPLEYPSRCASRTQLGTTEDAIGGGHKVPWAAASGGTLPGGAP